LSVSVWLYTYDTANVILKLSSVCIIVFHVELFDLFMDLVFILGLFEGETPLNSFATNFEPEPDSIFCGQFGYCRM